MRLAHSASMDLNPVNHTTPEGPYLLGFARSARNLPQIEHTMVVPGTGDKHPLFMRFSAKFGGNSRGGFLPVVEPTGRVQRPESSNHTHGKDAHGYR